MSLFTTAVSLGTTAYRLATGAFRGDSAPAPASSPAAGSGAGAPDSAITIETRTFTPSDISGKTGKVPLGTSSTTYTNRATGEEATPVPASAAGGSSPTMQGPLPGIPDYQNAQLGAGKAPDGSPLEYPGAKAALVVGAILLLGMMK